MSQESKDVFEEFGQIFRFGELARYWEDRCGDEDRFIRALAQLMCALRNRTAEGIEFLEVAPEEDPVRLSWATEVSPEGMISYLSHAGPFPINRYRAIESEAIRGARDMDDLNRRMESVRDAILYEVPVPPTLAEAIEFLRTRDGW